MTRESSLWACLKSALPLEAHAVRIENTCELGTPDVNMYAAAWEGWVELKVQEAPKRKTTKFRCEHFTLEQRVWLAERTRAGGNAYLLLQVEWAGRQSLPGSGLYLWIRGDIAAVWVDFCTLDELIEKSAWSGNSLEALVEYLCL